MEVSVNAQEILRDSGDKIVLCSEVETVREFVYIGDDVSAGGGCDAAVAV